MTETRDSRLVADTERSTTAGGDRPSPAKLLAAYRFYRYLRRDGYSRRYSLGCIPRSWDRL